MTDYGAILDSCEDTVVEKPKKTKKRCSDNSSVIELIKHAKAFRKVLKAAEKDGFCLDEIMSVAKELDNE